jgi:hypothetical protein
VPIWVFPLWLILMGVGAILIGGPLWWVEANYLQRSRLLRGFLSSSKAMRISYVIWGAVVLIAGIAVGILMIIGVIDPTTTGPA